MDLRVARVREEGAALVRAPRGGHVRIHRVRGEVIRSAVATRAEQDGVPDVPFQGAGDQVTAHDATRLAVDDDQVEHLAVREHRDGALVDLPHHRLIGAEQQLLSGLAARVERPRDLRAAERSVVEQTAVLARERHTLRHALVDDVHAQLREAEHVRFAGAVVTTFDGVVEQPLDAVAVVLIVLRRVDPALRGDAVGAPRAVVDAEALDVVAQLAKRRRGRRAGETGPDDDDGVFPPIGRTHQLRLEAVSIPFLRERTAGNLRVESHRVKYTHSGMIAKPPLIRIARTVPSRTSRFVYTGWSAPIDWKALEIPWRRCRPMSIMQTTYTATQSGEEKTSTSVR